MGRKKGKKTYAVIGLLIALAMVAGLVPTVSEAGINICSGNRDKVNTLCTDGRSYEYGFINEVMFEGDTSDAYFTKLIANDPTALNIIYLPNTSGELLTAAGATSLNLADGEMLIGNSGGTAVGVTPSGDATITNAGVISLAANTVDSAELVANSVDTTALFYNAVSLSLAAASTNNSVEVEPSSVWFGTRQTLGTAVVNGYIVSKISSDSDGDTWMINTGAAIPSGNNNTTFEILFMRP